MAVGHPTGAGDYDDSAVQCSEGMYGRWRQQSKGITATEGNNLYCH